MITLGDLRKAGAGLPDETPIGLLLLSAPDGLDVEFVDVKPSDSKDFPWQVELDEKMLLIAAEASIEDEDEDGEDTDE